MKNLTVVALDDGHDIDDNMVIEKHIKDILDGKYKIDNLIYQLEGPWPAIVALKIKKCYEMHGLEVPQIFVSDTPYDSHITDPQAILYSDHKEIKSACFDPEFADLKPTAADFAKAKEIIKDNPNLDIMAKSFCYVRENNIPSASQINNVLDDADEICFRVFSGLTSFNLTPNNQKKIKLFAMQGALDTSKAEIIGFNFTKFSQEAKNNLHIFLKNADKNMNFLLVSLSGKTELLKVDGSKKFSSPLHYAYFSRYLQEKKFGWLPIEGDPTTTGPDESQNNPLFLLPACQFPAQMHYHRNRAFGLNRFMEETSGGNKEEFKKSIQALNAESKTSENSDRKWQNYIERVWEGIEKNQISCDMVAFDLAAEFCIDEFERKQNFSIQPSAVKLSESKANIFFIDDAFVLNPDNKLLLDNIAISMSAIVVMKNKDQIGYDSGIEETSPPRAAVKNGGAQALPLQAQADHVNALA